MSGMPPSVTMLWQPIDPDIALTSKFGFSDGVAAGAWVTAVLGEQWDIRVTACEQIVLSDHNALAWIRSPIGRLVVKWSVASEGFVQLSELAQLTRWLDEHGVPVSAPVPTPDGRLQVEVDGASIGVQRQIDGELLDVSRPDLVRAAGATLARLQSALAGYPVTDRLVHPTEAGALPDRIENWLKKKGDQLPGVAQSTLRRWTADAPSTPLPRQLGHHDYRAANLLCRDDRVVAVIDFEQARLDHCVVELARSAVLLGTRFRDWAPVSTDVHQQFLIGYQSVRPLTPDEAQWWPVLFLWQSLAMVPPGDDPTGWLSAAMAQLAEV